MEYYKTLVVSDLPNEVWLDIKDYEGLYQVSNLGRIKSIGHRIPIKNNFYRCSHDKILKQKLKKNGYLEVMLSKKSKKKIYSTHRLVGLAFLGEPIGERNIINHIDEQSTNNVLSNLEWVTIKENVNHGTGKERSRLHQMNHPSTSLPVVAISKHDGKELHFPSISEAARFMNCNSSRISALCNGTYIKRRFKDNNYNWQYET